MIHQGERLKLLRLKLKIKGEDMAKMLNFGPGYMSKLYKKEVLPSQTLRNIEQTFNVPKSWFLGEEDTLILNETGQIYETKKEDDLIANKVILAENLDLKQRIKVLESEILQLKAEIYDLTRKGLK